jgi:hypothetical protein
MYRPRCLALGIQIGNNWQHKGKWTNIFLEIDILCWTFGIELKW